MAFNNSNAARATNPRSGNEAWKASGFLNLYLPAKNGNRKKVGAIPLRDNNRNEKALLEWLNQDPEANVATLLSHLIIDYVPVDESDDNTFAML